jgi:hypothetical protein
MKPHAFELNPNHADNTELAVLKVMLVYEDTDAGLRAKLALEHLPRELRLAENFRTTFWRKDLLSLPWLREQAALEACDADAILISMDERADTPGEVKDWLNRWLHHKGSDGCALGILVDEQSFRDGEACPGITYLREFAQTAKAIFFAVFTSSNRSHPRNAAFVPRTGWDTSDSFLWRGEGLVPVLH